MDHATFLSLKSYLCEDGFLAVIVPEKANTWYLHMAFSHVKIKVKFYSVKNGILYILHVKMSVLNLCHVTLNFLYFIL